MNRGPRHGDGNAPPARTLILLGIGHTHAEIVRRWAEDPIEGCRLVCLSNHATATYSGMLPGTLGGQFSEDQMRIDLRRLVDRAGGRLVVGQLSGADLTGRRLWVDDGQCFSFDALSIGVGSVPAGMTERFCSPRLVPIKPMQTFLQRLGSGLRGLDEAEPDAPVTIVGGGVAAVEISLCLQQHLHRDPQTAARPIEIVTADQHVATGMTARSVRRLESLLAARHIRVRRGIRVVGIEGGQWVGRQGERGPAGCVILATGAAAPPVLDHFHLAKDERGFILTEPTLQTLDHRHVFAVGDAATIRDHPCPKAGVYAVRQGPVLWRNLRVFFSPGSPQSFRPQGDFLKLLNTGDGKAFLEYHGWTSHARWCRWLKDWIDLRFVRSYQV